MTTVKSFVERLQKIGIDVKLYGNYPWIYLHSVNGITIKEKWYGNHGFTICFGPLDNDFKKYQWNDIKYIFTKIRQVLRNEEPDYDYSDYYS